MMLALLYSDYFVMLAMFRKFVNQIHDLAIQQMAESLERTYSVSSLDNIILNDNKTRPEDQVREEHERQRAQRR